MRSEIVQYCARDVALLPGLYNVYNVKLRLPGENFWQVQVREATKDRIKLSQSPGYDGQAETEVCGPWDKESIEQAIDDWNDDVMFDALNNEDGNLDEDNNMGCF
jgi:exonuclease 3'-5' domain-containing protein 1